MQRPVRHRIEHGRPYHTEIADICTRTGHRLGGLNRHDIAHRRIPRPFGRKRIPVVKQIFERYTDRMHFGAAGVYVTGRARRCVVTADDAHLPVVRADYRRVEHEGIPLPAELLVERLAVQRQQLQRRLLAHLVVQTDIVAGQCLRRIGHERYGIQSIARPVPALRVRERRLGDIALPHRLVGRRIIEQQRVIFHRIERPAVRADEQRRDFVAAVGRQIGGVQNAAVRPDIGDRSLVAERQPHFVRQRIPRRRGDRFGQIEAAAVVQHVQPVVPGGLYHVALDRHRRFEHAELRASCRRQPHSVRSRKGRAEHVVCKRMPGAEMPHFAAYKPGRLVGNAHVEDFGQIVVGTERDGLPGFYDGGAVVRLAVYRHLSQVQTHFAHVGVHPQFMVIRPIGRRRPGQRLVPVDEIAHFVIPFQKSVVHVDEGGQIECVRLPGIFGRSRPVVPEPEERQHVLSARIDGIDVVLKAHLQVGIVGQQPLVIGFAVQRPDERDERFARLVYVEHALRHAAHRPRAYRERRHGVPCGIYVIGGHEHTVLGDGDYVVCRLVGVHVGIQPSVSVVRLAVFDVFGAHIDIIAAVRRYGKAVPVVRHGRTVP